METCVKCGKGTQRSADMCQCGAKVLSLSEKSKIAKRRTPEDTLRSAIQECEEENITQAIIILRGPDRDNSDHLATSIHRGGTTTEEASLALFRALVLDIMDAWDEA